MPYKDPEAKRLYNQRYFQNNKAKFQEINVLWHRQHPEKRRLYSKQYREKNRTLLRQKSKHYRSQNRLLYRLRNNARMRAMYAQDPAAFRLKNATWRRTHPEQHYHSIKASHDRRRMRLGNKKSDLSAAQWQEIQEVFRYRCAYCGKYAKGNLTQDHITPVKYDGLHTLHNIVPSCKSCNSRKHVGPPLTPIQPLLLTLAHAYTKTC